MKKLLLIVLVGFLFSCGAHRKIVTKKSKTKTEEVVSVPVKTETKEEEPKEIVEVEVTKPKIPASTEEYIERYKDIAVHEMREYGIPASITLAQGILESGSGKGRLAVQANNHFGIKCHGWEGAKIYHDDDALQECFRKYSDAGKSFRDHSLFLTNRRRYARLFDLRITDYKGWAKELRRAGYATDKRYPQKLIDLIERYSLDRFDEKSKNKNMATSSARIKEYTVVQGDTLYSISKRYNLSVDLIKRMNDLNDNTLKIGQILKLSDSQN